MMNKDYGKNKKAMSYLSLITSMLIFGTIGIAVRETGLPSGFIAAVRGAIGAFFMLPLILLRGRRPSFSAMRRNLPLLIISGAFIGFNWILLFESYRYTTVATATVLYYTAPIFVAFLSPLLLGTRTGPRRILLILSAVVGMLLLSEVWLIDFSADSYLGYPLALGAAVLYASVTLLNKKMKDISAEDKTLFQLAVAGAVVLPYTLLTESVSAEMLNPLSIAILLLIGVLHTGIAYALYFGSLDALPADSVAVLSYVDPIFAVILSIVLLEEPMSLLSAVGAVIILVSAVLLERLPEQLKKEADKD